MRTFMLLVGFACAIGVGVLFGRATDEPQARQAVGVRVPDRVAAQATPPDSDRMELVIETRRDPQVEKRAIIRRIESLDESDAARALEALLKEEPSGERAEQARRLAHDIRMRALVAARSADERAAEIVAAEIRTERAYLEDQDRGGTMGLLRRLQDEPARLLDLTSDPIRFASLTERRVEGRIIPGTSLRSFDPIEDGTVLHFPAGAHTWKTSRLGRGRETKFPDDLLVRGDGMDATLVRIDEIKARGTVRSLTFQDCTIDCGNDYFTDLRSKEPVTIRLERCRVVRFDMGAGGSVMLAARTAAFHAIDCRIEAGFGRSPGSGNLFRVRAGLLVRMDRCTIVGPFRSVYDVDDAATFVFEECRFEQQAVPLDKPPEGVRFFGCTSTPPPARCPTKPRPLTDLNPDWKSD